MDLVSTVEIADMLGISRQRVDQLRRADDAFPDPISELAIGRIWLRSDIEAWGQATGRLPTA